MSTPKHIQLLQKLFEVICPERVDEIAKETGFIQRKRLVSASDFLSLLFHVHGNLADCSIQELCTTLQMKQAISISRAAMDKKFTPEATAFLQRLIQEFVWAQHQLSFSSLSLSEPWPFTSIRVLDSTTVSVPDRFQKRAQKTKQASAKIQFELDLLSGQSTFLHVAFHRMNDAKVGAMRIPFLTEHELCLQDLGYFNFEQLKKIEEKKGFFITKIRTDAYAAFENLFPSYHSNGEVIQSSLYHRIDFVALCKKLLPEELLELEGVYFGRDAHFPARCIIFSHDEQGKAQHIKKINRRAQKSGKVPKQVVRDLAGITIYMTNLPEWMSARHIMELYRLRWQIELHFKVWKSDLGINHFKVMKKDRWLCHLYGTILVYFISQLMAYQIRNFIWKEKGIEISEMVAIRSIATEILPKLYEECIKKEKGLKDFIHLTTEFLLKTARKSKSTKGTAFQRLQFT